MINLAHAACGLLSLRLLHDSTVAFLSRRERGGAAKSGAGTMKATLKGKYENIKSSATASLSVDVKASDVKLQTTVTDVTVARGPNLPYAFSFSLEKPGSFSIGYTPQKDARFQFRDSMKVLGRAVDLTYTHARGENRTVVDGAVAFDARNRMAVSHALGTKEWKVGYTYAHGALRRTVAETSYDFKGNAWYFAVTRRLEGGDAVKATYGTSSQALGLEWARNSPITGTFKISASINVAEKNIVPKLTAESTWNYEI